MCNRRFGRDLNGIWQAGARQFVLLERHIRKTEIKNKQNEEDEAEGKNVWHVQHSIDAPSTEHRQQHNHNLSTKVYPNFIYFSAFWIGPGYIVHVWKRVPEELKVIVPSAVYKTTVCQAFLFFPTDFPNNTTLCRAYRGSQRQTNMKI